MPLTPWKQLSSEVVQKNSWWEYRFDRCVMPNGKEGEYHYAQTGNSVAVVAVTDEGKILMCRQYRYLFERESLEVPTGGVKPEQTPLEAASAELQEEGQVRARFIEQVGVFEPCNGFVKELCYAFVATDLESVDVAPDETEEFEICFFTPEEVDEGIHSGKLTDGIMIAAWYLAKPHVLKIIEEQKK